MNHNTIKILELGVTPEKAPDEPTYLTLSFEKGKPVALDGKQMSMVAIIEALNEIGGKNGNWHFRYGRKSFGRNEIKRRV